MPVSLAAHSPEHMSRRACWPPWHFRGEVHGSGCADRLTGLPDRGRAVGFSCTRLHGPASLQCSYLPFTFLSSTFFPILMQRSLFCPHVLSPARLWTLSSLQPLQPHPACARGSWCQRQLVPGWSGALYTLMSCLSSLEGHAFLRACQELRMCGFASLLAARQVEFV